MPTAIGKDAWNQPERFSAFMVNIFKVPVFHFQWHFSCMYLPSIVIRQNQRESIHRVTSK